MPTINLDSGTGTGTAEWPVVWLCDLASVSPSVTGTAVAAATEVLNAATGGQFGLTERVIRPCRLEDDCTVSDWASVGWRPSAVRCGCDGHQRGCGCRTTATVWLADFTHSIEAAVVDGVTLPPAAYRLEDGHRVVRQDGGEWPHCQSLDLPAGQPGTWTLRVTAGRPVPPLGQLAVGELACTLIDLIADPNGCRLPSSWSQISREGVSITSADLAALAAAGKIGLDICDLFVQTYNPEALRADARVTSVDDRVSRYV